MSKKSEEKTYPTVATPLTAAQVNPFAQLQAVNPYGGMTTQVLPTVVGAQSFNAAQLTQTVPDIYIGGAHRI
jgi:hypothetical protein